MIEDGITEGNYIETSNNTLCDLKRFQDFLYRHFHKHKDYEAMRPRSNQPGRFFVTAKTHKLKSIEDISLQSLKFRIKQELIFTMLQKSLQNTSVLYLRMNFQFQTHLVFQNY